MALFGYSSARRRARAFARPQIAVEARDAGGRGRVAGKSSSVQHARHASLAL
jgi:hypothetical protein